MKNSKQWIQPRHNVVLNLVRPPFGAFIRWKYGITTEVFPNQGDRAYLILMNHQTAYDQFFVSMTFRRHVYFLASEDIFSLGWISRVLSYLVAPIPIKKQTTDLQAVKNCIRIAREGGSVCIAPEGHRTYHGKTVYIKPSIGALAKKMGLPIAIFRIEDGYGIQPRWSDVVRKGKMRSYVKRVIEPEEYASMNGEQLAELISQELYNDEVKVTGRFRHKKNAEFLERLVYVCPWCGLSAFESQGDIITCKRCGRQIRHLDTKELEGIGFDFPHRFVGDWYDWQNDYVNRLDLTTLTEAPVYEETVRLSQVFVSKYKKLLKKQAKVCLYGDRITVDGREFFFDQVGAVTVLGKNKLNIYDGNEVLQLKGSKRFNAVKYLNFYHRYKNMKTGDENGQFLGF